MKNLLSISVCFLLELRFEFDTKHLIFMHFSFSQKEISVEQTQKIPVLNLS